jgi:5-methylcytosine-specific restriction protein A
LRRRKLLANPLCEPCWTLGRLEPATVIDHRVPIAKGGDAFPELEGLMAMCEACHNRKSQGEQHGNAFLIKGTDARGLPIDTNHPFFGKGVIPSNHERISVRDRGGSRAGSKFRK